MILLGHAFRPAQLGENAQLAIGFHLLIGGRHARRSIGKHQHTRSGTHGSFGNQNRAGKNAQKREDQEPAQ